MTEAPQGTSQPFINGDELEHVLGAIRTRIKAVFVLLAAVVLATILVLGLADRHRGIQEIRALAARHAEHVVTVQTKRIAQTRDFLHRLATLDAVRAPGAPACADALTEILSLTPQYVNLGATLANGDLVCSAAPLAAPINVADRPHFQRTLATETYGISTFQQDQVDRGATITFVNPVYSRQEPDTLIGSVFAVVSMDWWSGELTDMGLPEGTVAFVEDESGQIVASFPKRPDLQGTDFADLPTSFDQKTRDAEIDGVRFALTRHLLLEDDLGNPAFMWLGLPLDSGVQEANRALWLELAGAFAVLSLIWFMTAHTIQKRVFGPRSGLHDALHRDAPGDHPTGRNAGTARPSDFHRIARSFQQITQDQQRAQSGLQSSTDQMSALIAALPDNIFRISQDERIIEYHSPDTADLLHAPDFFLGQQLNRVLPPDAYACFAKALQTHKTTGKVVSWEYHLDLAMGRQDFEARISAITGRDEYLVVARNITQRCIAERGRTEAEERLNRIIANLPGAIIAMQHRGTDLPDHLFVSPRVEDLWGYTTDEVYENPGLLRSSVKQADLEAMFAKMYQAVEDGKPFTHRFQITTRSGARKWLDIHASVRRDADDMILTDSFYRDVTAEVKMQAALETQTAVALQAQKQESIGHLTGGVAHDFNNLLAVILGNLELLREEIADPDLHQLIDASIGATHRGADLTRKMLAFARKARLQPEVIELNDIVREMVQWAGRAFPANTAIETRLSENLATLEADPGSTESALLNLLLNARDAMPDGGRITVETGNVTLDAAEAGQICPDMPAGPYVMLAVTDTGHGIAKDELARIFDPFYSTKAPGSGSGLGLSMIEGFLRQSKGGVRVMSEPGKGTRFELLFRPSIKGRQAELPDLHTPEGHGKGARILVAEDEPEVMALIVTVLERAGYDLVAAHSGDAALAAFDADPTFDLLLTDIVMPGSLQGPELAAVLKERAPQLPVVYMTGYASETTLHRIAAPSEGTLLSKPFMRKDLLAAVRQALQG
ncbi:response regulator [Tropicibacter oceani]|uniref:histidine kinase n=1 Tax=Tropicibacter oceani TaxID=3058420 RepID=A0ABY8QIY3_9RHOB|nr:response regulator [Tropicibacter oceani]WGW04112.1 response regulator [Tropicibacter oceani]